MILLILVTLSISYLVWCLVSLWLNTRYARSMKIPLVILPIDHLNVLWMIFEPVVFYAIGPLLGDSSFARYGRRGWHYTDKNRAHLEMGLSGQW